MERLTSNKPVEEMGMYELAHNCCYVKDGCAWYRDFETDIDARELARRLMVEFGVWSKDAEEFSDDEFFDETMFDNLQFSSITDITREGLITLFYHHLWAMADLHSRLKEYEDLEEQGLLLRLPCKVGDTIYRINQYAKEPIISMKVLQVRFGELYIGNKFLRIDAINDEDMGEFCYLQDEIGKTVFLTKEEAEQALTKMKEG